MEFKQSARIISPGIAIGNALKIPESDSVSSEKTEFQLEMELKRFQENVEEIIAELSDLHKNITTGINSQDLVFTHFR